jgi:hypothetical protein
MAEVNGDVDVFPEYLIPVIEGIARKENFVNFSIRTETGLDVGSGLVGIIYRVVVNGADSRSLSLIAKIPPANKARRTQLGAIKLFQREVYMYNEVLPAFVEFQHEYGITDEDVGFYGFPKCYYAHYDEEREEAAIIMEDLTLAGFKSLDKHEIPDFQHSRRLFIELGHFHATSIAFKHRKADVFEKFRKLHDITKDISAESVINPMIQYNLERAMDTLLPHEEYKKEKLVGLKESMIRTLFECTSGEAAEPLSVINHGDCWISNTLYKYENGTPVKVALIDWQVSRYSSPALDILHYIFTSTDREFRKQHYDTLLQIYYKSFREQIERFNLDPVNLFPFTSLLRQVKQYGKYGFLMALFIVPILCSENAALPDFNKIADEFAFQPTDVPKLNIENTNVKYNQRMGDIIRDIIRLGYL